MVACQFPGHPGRLELIARQRDARHQQGQSQRAAPVQLLNCGAKQPEMVDCRCRERG